MIRSSRIALLFNLIVSVNALILYNLICASLKNQCILSYVNNSTFQGRLQNQCTGYSINLACGRITLLAMESIFPLYLIDTGTSRAKKGHLVWPCFKTSQRWAGQGPSPSDTASPVAQTTWRPAKDMSSHDQSRPGTTLRTGRHRPRAIEKGLGESI